MNKAQARECIFALKEVKLLLCPKERFICNHICTLRWENKISIKVTQILLDRIRERLCYRNTVYSWLVDNTEEKVRNTIESIPADNPVFVEYRKAWIDVMIQELKEETGIKV